MALIRHIAHAVSSLRLTVALLAMAMFLILAGTLAQVHEGIWSVVDRYFRSLFVIIPFQLFVPEKILRLPGAIPFPGGLLLGAALLINLLCAHAARFKFTLKRTGIILSHLGVILLIAGEFITGFAAQEGNMTIDEGGSSRFVEDIRTCELAVVDASSPDDDLVVVVPQRALVRFREPIDHPLLPFQVRVDEWMPNSRILGPMQASPAQRARADSGLGKTLAAVPILAATGVDGETVDVASAYVTLSRNGQSLGSFLVSVFFDKPEQVIVDGKPYAIQLRFRRTYKPYTLHLIDFKHDKFVGTDKPRNFSSLVRLVDPQRHVDREVLIYMNHPLRYSGETFYQSAFKQGDTGTILQVVRNPGWLIPYISCSMVALGLLLHFGIRLSASLRRIS